MLFSFLNANIEAPIIMIPTTKARASIRDEGAAVVSAWAYQVLIASFTNFTWVVVGNGYFCSGEVILRESFG